MVRACPPSSPPPSPRAPALASSCVCPCSLPPIPLLSPLVPVCPPRCPPQPLPQPRRGWDPRGCAPCAPPSPALRPAGVVPGMLRGKRGAGGRALPLVLVSGGGLGTPLLGAVPLWAAQAPGQRWLLRSTLSHQQRCVARGRSGAEPCRVLAGQRGLILPRMSAPGGVPSSGAPRGPILQEVPARCWPQLRAPTPAPVGCLVQRHSRDAAQWCWSCAAPTRVSCRDRSSLVGCWGGAQPPAVPLGCRQDVALAHRAPPGPHAQCGAWGSLTPSLSVSTPREQNPRRGARRHLRYGPSGSPLSPGAPAPANEIRG